jgi:serine protease Do
MTMRKYVMTSIVLLPLLLTFSQAAQNWSVDPPAAPWVFSSEDSGTSSYLGVDISDVTTERLSALKLKEEKGVEVTMVDQDAPAGKAGIKEHDVILTMNGTSIESGAQLRRMIHETPPGRVVTFGLSRDGQPMTVKVQLADKHNEYALVHPKAKEFHFEMPAIPPMDIDIPAIQVMVTSSARSGLTMENLSSQLGEFFGVKNGNGVLIRSVEKGSRADKAGFRAGDVIVKVGDQAVHDTSDFSHGMKSRSGNSVNVVVVRDKKEQTLTLSLPDRKESGDLLEEESSDEIWIDAESRVELGELRNELAKLRPQMELAAEDFRKSAEGLRKSLLDEQKKFREEGSKQRVEFRKQERELRQKLDQMRRNVITFRSLADI